jgi:adenosylcobalamin-dependent ribonucleoside-triphosphate reductase
METEKNPMKDWSAQRARDGVSRERDAEFTFLSFRLRDEFLESFRAVEPDWGFPIGDGNTLGEYAWITKYSRLKADGTKERFWEGLRRVIEGMYSIQKDHALRHRLPWNEDVAHRSAQEAYVRAFAGKWSPPGRGFWMMGTEFVNGRNDSSALQNCAFISTADIAESGNPSRPFSTLMSMSMLGIGVGFDTAGKDKLEIQEPGMSSMTYHIEDSREGWCRSVDLMLTGYLVPGKKIPEFDFSAIRRAGSPIRGFGGTSAGPKPLRKLHSQLQHLLRDRHGDMLSSTDIVDVMNMIGKCVVAANVRSSAEIALGDADDTAFLDLKDWNVNPKRMGADGWGYTSNNSVVARTGQDLGHLAERMALNGEPGAFWIDVARSYGRLADGPNIRDRRVMGCNPCGEQPLENNELCTLVETYPTRADSLEDYLRTLKFAYLYGKTVTLLATQWPLTNEVMVRNRRIGTSMTGIAQFVDHHGWPELTRWQDAGYKEIRAWDGIYSEWLGVRESVRVTTVKPSGTVALLFGVTPGVHWPKESGEYIRTVREHAGSPIVDMMRDAGYRVEPSVSNPETTMIIYLPTEGPQMRAERDVSVWEKASLAAHCQRWWSDNSVSVTLTFDADTEASQVGPILNAFDGQLKSASFLPTTEGIYEQAPYQRVSREAWADARSRATKLDWTTLYDGGTVEDAEGELYCTTDSCEIRR